MRGVSPIIATLVIIAVTIVIASVTAFTLLRVSRGVEPRGGTIIVQNARGIIVSPARTRAVIYLTMCVHGTTPVEVVSPPYVIVRNQSYSCTTYSPINTNHTINPNQVIEVTIVCDSNNIMFAPYDVVYISMRYTDIATGTVSELYVPVMLEPYYI